MASGSGIGMGRFVGAASSRDSRAMVGALRANRGRMPLPIWIDWQFKVHAPLRYNPLTMNTAYQPLSHV